MRIGRILYPIKALGPGTRIGIWVQGCPRECPGCANPELQPEEAKDMPLALVTGLVIAAVKSYGLDGITLTGGEPVLQAGELSVLLDKVRPYCSDVLMFTGYRMKELQEMHDRDVDHLLSRVSVLVDGPYVQELNMAERLRGSTNQEIHFLKENIRAKYEPYLSMNERTMDNFVAQDGVVSVGIHPRGFS